MCLKALRELLQTGGRASIRMVAGLRRNQWPAWSRLRMLSNICMRRFILGWKVPAKKSIAKVRRTISELTSRRRLLVDAQLQVADSIGF